MKRTLQFLSGFDYIDSRYDKPIRYSITFESKISDDIKDLYGRMGIFLYSDEIIPMINKIRKKYNVKNFSFEDYIPWNIKEKITYGRFLRMLND